MVVQCTMYIVQYYVGITVQINNTGLFVCKCNFPLYLGYKFIYTIIKFYKFNS